MNIYYVYMYRHPITNTPFYVGMSGNMKRRRQYDHLANAKNLNYKTKSHKIHTIRKILGEGLYPIIQIIHENISKEQAIELEMFLIKEIGRRDLGTGTLTNLTDGGEGHFGMSNKNRRMLSMQRKNIITAKHIDTGEIIKLHKDDPRWMSDEYVGINHGNKLIIINQYDRYGENNPAWGIKRNDLALSNKDPILNKQRRESYNRNKFIKVLREFGFTCEPEARQYITYLSELFYNFGYFAFIKNIKKSIENYNNIDLSNISNYRMMWLIKQITNHLPKSDKKIIRK